MKSHTRIYFAVVGIIFLTTQIRTWGGPKEVIRHTLTDAEKQVILNKGTEMPFSGIYVDHHDEGVYLCKQCDAPLYRSQDKFDSHCGWPSFDDEIPGAIERIPDRDGKRTEIICANCKAHLGHVFKGEGLTPKNTRHCVNSISLNFLPTEDAAMKDSIAYFAGGCFWGVEYLFQQLNGVTETRVGYMGGHLDHPTYQQVCTGTTGHYEAIRIKYNPEVIDFHTLARYFLEIHDPTQTNGQGPDIGEQYQSVIFYVNEDQKRIAAQLIDLLTKKGYSVATQLKDATTFWEAEEYHQDYYKKTGKYPYCHSYIKRF